jgi:hypothetical protein
MLRIPKGGDAAAAVVRGKKSLVVAEIRKQCWNWMHNLGLELERVQNERARVHARGVQEAAHVWRRVGDIPTATVNAWSRQLTTAESNGWWHVVERIMLVA